MNFGRVAVIGLAGQSAFMTADHFPAPGETISCSSLFFEPGGKGYNQAIACARQGVETVFVGAVGNDSNAKECRKGLEQEGIKVCFVEKPQPTAYAVITTIPGGENTVQVLGGASKSLTEADLCESAVFDGLEKNDYLLIQNELSPECLKAAVMIAKKKGILVILNPAPAVNLATDLLSLCDVITPNYGEAKCLLGFPEEYEPSPQELVDALKRINVKKAVVTMGGRGALIVDEEQYKVIPAFSAGEVVDTTGAGDTFNGTLTAALALRKELEEAVQIATVAAGISVTRRGAAGSIPTKNEIIKIVPSYK